MSPVQWKRKSTRQASTMNEAFFNTGEREVRCSMGQAFPIHCMVIGSNDHGRGATIVRAGKERLVDPEMLVRGDVFALRPGHQVMRHAHVADRRVCFRFGYANWSSWV